MKLNIEAFTIFQEHPDFIIKLFNAKTIEFHGKGMAYRLFRKRPELRKHFIENPSIFRVPDAANIIASPFFHAYYELETYSNQIINLIFDQESYGNREKMDIPIIYNERLVFDFMKKIFKVGYFKYTNY